MVSGSKERLTHLIEKAEPALETAGE